MGSTASPSSLDPHQAGGTPLAGWLQIVFGIVPAIILTTGASLGLATYANLGVPVVGTRLYFGFWLGLGGLVGLVWAAFRSPRWAAVPIVGFLLCGILAVIVIAWPGEDGRPAVLIVGVGPLVVGVYQCIRAIRRLAMSPSPSLPNKALERTREG
jgi:hypothetical protein